MAGAEGQGSSWAVSHSILLTLDLGNPNAPEMTMFEAYGQVKKGSGTVCRLVKATTSSRDQRAPCSLQQAFLSGSIRIFTVPLNFEGSLLYTYVCITESWPTLWACWNS